MDMEMTMDSLDRAIELVMRWKADRQKQRADVLSRLDAVVKECQTAVQVWQGYLAKPGAPGDQWTIVSWVGPDRAKQLHEINLRAKQNVEEVCRMAGPKSGRFVALDDDVIEMAYRMLKPGETGADAANTAVQRLQERMEYIRGLMQRLKAAPVKAMGKKPATKHGTPKTAGKKATKPSKKKAAPAKK
jgi:DNA-binding protein H-NS